MKEGKKEEKVRLSQEKIESGGKKEKKRRKRVVSTKKRRLRIEDLVVLKKRLQEVKDRGQVDLRGKRRVSSEQRGILPNSKVFHPASTAATGEAFLFGVEGPLRSDLKQDSCLGLGQASGREKVEDLGQCSVGFGDMMGWLNSRVDDFLGQFCKTSSTGRLFPLPTSPYILGQVIPQASACVRAILQGLVFSLNSLNGEGIRGPPRASEYQTKVLQGLIQDCERAATWSLEGEAPTWTDFF